MVWLRSSILVLNTVLCLIYLLLGRLPFFNLGFFYNHRFGVLVSVAILLYITWRCVIQYTSGSIARTELALRYLVQTRFIAYLLVILPVLFLLIHSLFGLMANPWGNVVFGSLALLSCVTYYNSFATFREADLGAVGSLLGIRLPKARAEKEFIEIIQIGPVNLGSVGTALGAEWGIAAFLRGSTQLLFPVLGTVVKWVLSE